MNTCKEIDLSNYISTGRLSQIVRSEGIHVAMGRWSQTAGELISDNRHNRNSINNSLQIYLEINEHEFRDWQIQEFLKNILTYLLENDRHTFIAIELIECRA